MNKEKCNDFKEQVLIECKNVVLAKLTVLEKELKYLAHDIAEDTKSSAGDKFETAREMANIEINKLQEQVYNLNKSMTLLNTLPASKGPKIGMGSLILTDTGWLFLSISLGQLLIDSEQILVISPAAPLAQMLLGKKSKESVTFNGKVYEILSIY